jgi:hypothetical protein
MAREVFDAFELFPVEDAQFVVLILYGGDKLENLAHAVEDEFYVVGHGVMAVAVDAVRGYRRMVLRLTLQYLEAALHPWARASVYVLD